MSETYRVVITGVQEGFTKEQVIGQLAQLFKSTEELISQKFDALPFVVKRGVDLLASGKYKAALEQRGCVCDVELENEALILPQISALNSESATSPKSDRPNASGELNYNLIKCSICKRDISPLAESCPGCGAPNNWVHPEVNQLLVRVSKLTLPEKCKYWSNKAEVWGETEEDKLSLGSWISLIVVIIVTLFLMGVHPGFIVGPIAYYYYILRPKKKTKKTFKANFLTGAWESSNESFWKPVRNCIKNAENDNSELATKVSDEKKLAQNKEVIRLKEKMSLDFPLSADEIVFLGKQGISTNNQPSDKAELNAIQDTPSSSSVSISINGMNKKSWQIVVAILLISALSAALINWPALNSDKADAIKEEKNPERDAKIGAQRAKIIADINSQKLTEAINKALSGDAVAQLELGNIYYFGAIVPKNEPEALEWYKKSADQGNAQAMQNLGAIYHTGAGVPKDDVQATLWFQRSAALGNSQAKKELDSMNAQAKQKSDLMNGQAAKQASSEQTVNDRQYVYPSPDNMQKVARCEDVASVPGGGYCLDVYWGCLHQMFGDANFSQLPIPMDPGYFNQMCSLFHKMPAEMTPLQR